MAKYITGAPADNIQLDSSRPIYVLEWTFTGATTRLSTGGAVTFDGNVYSPGVDLQAYSDGTSAVVSIPATTAYIGNVLDGDWRNGTCDLYAIPSTPADTSTYLAEEGVLLLSGSIDAVTMTGNIINVTIASTILAGKYAPRLYYSEACNHIPGPGSVIEWENDTKTIEGADAFSGYDFSGYNFWPEWKGL